MMESYIPNYIGYIIGTKYVRNLSRFLTPSLRNAKTVQIRKVCNLKKLLVKLCIKSLTSPMRFVHGPLFLEFLYNPTPRVSRTNLLLVLQLLNWTRGLIKFNWKFPPLKISNFWVGGLKIVVQNCKKVYNFTGCKPLHFRVTIWVWVIAKSH
jgi:hypothetical protein